MRTITGLVGADVVKINMAENRKWEHQSRSPTSRVFPDLSMPGGELWVPFYVSGMTRHGQRLHYHQSKISHCPWRSNPRWLAKLALQATNLVIRHNMYLVPYRLGLSWLVLANMSKITKLAWMNEIELQVVIAHVSLWHILTKVKALFSAYSLRLIFSLHLNAVWLCNSIRHFCWSLQLSAGDVSYPIAYADCLRNTAGIIEDLHRTIVTRYIAVEDRSCRLLSESHRQVSDYLELRLTEVSFETAFYA